jgi:hypothetical protein
MGHYAQVVLALIISTTLSPIAWGWARRSQTRQAAAPQLAGSYQDAPGIRLNQRGRSHYLRCLHGTE